MRNTAIILRRELASYFATPLAYVFILIFLALAAAFTFYLGGFYERGQADLTPFFGFHPWLYLFLIPAVSMRLWAEERRSGSIELLMTQPVTLWQAVLGKFLAAWVFAGLALALTFPLWITVNYLGDPDNGAILAAYVGSLLLAGGFLAIGSCMSALTRNVTVAFILAVVGCFVFLLAGYPMVLDVFRGWAPQAVVDAIASLSFLTHFEAISKGVLDLRDLLYFGMLIALFLVATAIVLDVRGRRALGAGALAALAVLFVGLTVLGNQLLRGARLDLTENRLYTIAPGTARIVGGLKEPVNLYFFFSEEAASRLPALKTYGLRVREFLEELAARSDGKLRLNVIDPQPFSEDEDRAAELGVASSPLGAAGEKLYFGLAGTNSTDGRAAIEFFDPSKEQFLEYDVAKLVYQLANPHKPVVGWLSGLPMSTGFDPASGQMREPWAVLAQTEQLFTVRNLGPDLSRIDADVDVLVIVHPKELPETALFAIDQYALRGGRVMVFVDPLAEQDSSGADPSNPFAQMNADRSSDLGRLFAAWGIEFDPGQVVVDAEHALTVTMRAGDAPVRHLGILGLDASAFNDQDVVTAGLSSVNIATAGAVRPAKGAKTKFEPLLQSSTQAGALPAARFAMLLDPSTLRDGFRPDGRRHAFAARVTGSVATAFPNGAPQGAADGAQATSAGGAPITAAAQALKASSRPLNVIVFADTDLLSDFLWVRYQNFFGQRLAQAWAGNGDLVWNALDNLAGSTDLISVRGRASYTRPFDRVEALRRGAEDRFRAKEQELQAELRATEEKLTQLQSARNEDSALILTPEQAAAIERFEQEKLRIRKELREVRHELDQDITALGNRLKFANIVLVPAAFAVVALLVATWRRRRRRASPPKPAAEAAT